MQRVQLSNDQNFGSAMEHLALSSSAQSNFLTSQGSHDSHEARQPLFVFLAQANSAQIVSSGLKHHIQDNYTKSRFLERRLGPIPGSLASSMLAWQQQVAGALLLALA